MKIELNSIKNWLTARNHNQSGMATLVFVVLLAIMMILVTAEARSLIRLRQETHFLQQQQIKRLNMTTTNTITRIDAAPPLQAQ